MAGGYPVVDVHWVDAAVDFDFVVDGGCSGGAAPMAGGVVFEEGGALFSVFGGVDVASGFAVASHVRCRPLRSRGMCRACP